MRLIQCRIGFESAQSDRMAMHINWIMMKSAHNAGRQQGRDCFSNPQIPQVDTTKTSCAKSAFKHLFTVRNV